MFSIAKPEDIDVIVLCGGLGTRLRSVLTDRPKAMAEINNRPFLDILIDYIAGYNFKRFILCIGYMSDMVKEYFRKEDKGLTILFSEEKELLGTAGAIKHAEPLIRSDPFLVANGDSFCRINLQDFMAFHADKKSSASIALVSPEKDEDYGVVALNDNRRIVSFNEKARPDTAGFINAGLYLFRRDVLDLIPKDTKYSLEYGLFPNMIDKGIYGYVTGEKLLDIGTPERYKTAEKLLSGKNK